MNDARRKLIAEAANLIDKAKDLLEQCREEEENYHSNMPEGIQAGAKGDDAQEAIDRLSQSCDELENIDLSDF